MRPPWQTPRSALGSGARALQKSAAEGEEFHVQFRTNASGCDSPLESSVVANPGKSIVLDAESFENMYVAVEPYRRTD